MVQKVVFDDGTKSRLHRQGRIFYQSLHLYSLYLPHVLENYSGNKNDLGGSEKASS